MGVKIGLGVFVAGCGENRIVIHQVNIVVSGIEYSLFHRVCTGVPLLS